MVRWDRLITCTATVSAIIAITAACGGCRATCRDFPAPPTTTAADDPASVDTSLMPRCKAMHIEQLKYVTMGIDMGPENYMCAEGEYLGDTAYHDYGDSLCKRIMASLCRNGYSRESFCYQQTHQYEFDEREDILPCLIEKIKDTTSAVYMDGSATYLVSDVAIHVTFLILNNHYGFNNLDFCERELGLERDYCRMSYDVRITAFNMGAPAENYERRMTCYNTARKLAARTSAQFGIGK